VVGPRSWPPQPARSGRRRDGRDILASKAAPNPLQLVQGGATPQRQRILRHTNRPEGQFRPCRGGKDQHAAGTASGWWPKGRRPHDSRARGRKIFVCVCYLPVPDYKTAI
jgi:hypothetical protein